MEFIVVRFRDPRDVFVDGMPLGRTGEKLRVDKGKHTVHLGDPRNYDPTRRRPDVRGTTSIKPMEVFFEPEAYAAPRPAPRSSRRVRRQPVARQNPIRVDRERFAHSESYRESRPVASLAPFPHPSILSRCSPESPSSWLGSDVSERRGPTF